MDYYNISREYNKLQAGAGKIEAIKKAIEAADAEKDYDCAARFRFDYMYEAVFYDDIFKAIIMFPEYLSIYDEHYNEITYKYKDIDMFYSYNWVIGNSTSFYQIPMEKINKYLEDFKKRLIKHGYSLKLYYNILSRCLENIDEDKYKEAFNKFLNAKKDDLYNSEKDELFDRIYFELYHGSYKKAIELAKPILDNKIQENAGNIYNNIIYHHIKNNTVNNNLEELSKYIKILYTNTKKLLSHLARINTILNYYAIVDVDEGINFFRNHLNLNLKIRNPNEKFYFELSAYRLFRAVKEKQNRKTVKLNLDENFILYKKDGIYSIDELIDYFKSDAIYIAKKFDERNRNNKFMQDVVDEGFLN